MRYEQPINWPPNADYTNYLHNEIMTESKLLSYAKAKKALMRVPKLGEIGCDEILLKLASYINET